LKIFLAHHVFAILSAFVIACLGLILFALGKSAISSIISSGKSHNLNQSHFLTSLSYSFIFLLKLLSSLFTALTSCFSNIFNGLISLNGFNLCISSESIFLTPTAASSHHIAFAYCIARSSANALLPAQASFSCLTVLQSGAVLSDITHSIHDFNSLLICCLHCAVVDVNSLPAELNKPSLLNILFNSLASFALNVPLSNFFSNSITFSNQLSNQGLDLASFRLSSICLGLLTT
jgi:ABC-type multidrug transport system fused ATPase/permease subunit